MSREARESDRAGSLDHLQQQLSNSARRPINGRPPFYQSAVPSSAADRTRKHILYVGAGAEEVESWVRRRHRAGLLASRGPLVIVRSALLPPSLIASQLFGHVRQGLSGCDGATEGALRAARGGVVYLADVDMLPLDVQRRLADAITRLCVQPIGSNRPRPIDTRLITSTGPGIDPFNRQHVHGQLLRICTPRHMDWRSDRRPG